MKKDEKNFPFTAESKLFDVLYENLSLEGRLLPSCRQRVEMTSKNVEIMWRRRGILWNSCGNAF